LHRIIFRRNNYYNESQLLLNELSQTIQQAQNGSLPAFKILVEQHQEFLYRVAWRLLLNKQDAEDAVQECFIRVWQNLRRFDANKKFTTWLYKIIVNLCYDRLRAQRRTGDRHDTIDEAVIEAPESLEKIIQNKDIKAVILHLLTTLPPKQRAVLTLRDFEDRDMEEIAVLLQISSQAVKSNLFVARKQLREKLLEYNAL